MPDTELTAASLRGSGSAGASAHLSKLPMPDVWATKTVDCAVVPSEPPMYRILVPSWTAVPSVRGCGRARSAGDGCHGTNAPRGAGHGKVSFSDQALTENYAVAMDEVIRLKPSAAKGRYVKKATLATTMGPGIPVDPAKTKVTADELANA